MSELGLNLDVNWTLFTISLRLLRAECTAFGLNLLTMETLLVLSWICPLTAVSCQSESADPSESGAASSDFFGVGKTFPATFFCLLRQTSA